MTDNQSTIQKTSLEKKGRNVSDTNRPSITNIKHSPCLDLAENLRVQPKKIAWDPLENPYRSPTKFSAQLLFFYLWGLYRNFIYEVPLLSSIKIQHVLDSQSHRVLSRRDFGTFWTFRAYVVLAPFLERANKLFFCVNHLVEKIILLPALHVQHVHHVLPFGMKQI